MSYLQSHDQTVISVGYSASVKISDFHCWRARVKEEGWLGIMSCSVGVRENYRNEKKKYNKPCFIIKTTLIRVSGTQNADRNKNHHHRVRSLVQGLEVINLHLSFSLVLNGQVLFSVHSCM